jgi:hypothetical protein
MCTMSMLCFRSVAAEDVRQGRSGLQTALVFGKNWLFDERMLRS